MGTSAFTDGSQEADLMMTKPGSSGSTHEEPGRSLGKPDGSCVFPKLLHFLIHANNRSILGDDSSTMHLLLLKPEMADWALKVLGGSAKQSVESALK